MNFLGRLKRWLFGDDRAGDSEDDADARGPPTTPPHAPSGPTSPAEQSLDAPGSEAESTDAASDDPALKCTVCGTVADSGTTACPLCGSTDVRPVTDAADAVDPTPDHPGGRSDAAVSTLIEEAEPPAEGESTTADAAATRAGPETARPGTHAGGSTPRESEPTGADVVAEPEQPDGDEPTGEEDPTFAGPGPSRTSSTRSTDDEAVSRLQELKRRDAGDGDDSNGDDA